MDELPDVGLGTMGIEDPDTIAAAVEMGYRHLDTAQIYGNEAVVGDGVARADVDREDVFVATKVWADKLARGDVLSSTRESLEKLGLDAVDLLYVHRPIEDYDPPETLAAFDELHEEGLVRNVGVSNFTPGELDEARGLLDAPLFAHQTELHPLFYEEHLVAYAQEHDHYVVAYSPLAAGEVGDVPEVVEVAEKHDATPEQVSLAWLASKDNVVTIPKASSETHLRSNLAAADLELDAADVEKIESVEREEELFPE